MNKTALDSDITKLSRVFAPNVLQDATVQAKIQDALAYAEDARCGRVTIEDVRAVARSIADTEAKQQGWDLQEYDDDSEEWRDRGFAAITASTQKPKKDWGACLDRADRERLLVISETCAREASADPDVQRFRQEWLGDDYRCGQLLTPDEYEQMLRSRALFLLSPQQLRCAGVPLTVTAHSSITSRWENDSAAGSLAFTIVFPKEGVTLSVKQPAPEGRTAANGDWPCLPYEPARGSVLDVLRQAGREYARRYLWQEQDAARFLLTGIMAHVDLVDVFSRDVDVSPASMPAVEAQQGGFPQFLASRITVSVPHWFKPEVVANLFRLEVRTARGGPESAKEKIGRPPSNISLRIYRFVENERARIGLDGQPREWPPSQRRAIFEAWQADFGVLYEQGRFYRAYKRAAKVLAS